MGSAFGSEMAKAFVFLDAGAWKWLESYSPMVMVRAKRGYRESDMTIIVISAKINLCVP
jgi:hypothetical protein